MDPVPETPSGGVQSVGQDDSLQTVDGQRSDHDLAPPVIQPLLDDPVVNIDVPVLQPDVVSELRRFFQSSLSTTSF